MLIKELVTEAISVTSYEGPLVAALSKTIHSAIGQLSSLKGQLPKEEADLEDDDSTLHLFRKTITEQLFGILEQNLAKSVQSSLNASVGVPAITSVEFKELTGNTRGYAQGRDVVLSIKYAKAIAKRVAENILDTVYSSYNSGERAAGFYFVVRMISSGDTYYIARIDDVVRKVVGSMASVAIHELVHVLQHTRQEVRGRDSTEYRSYLDKHRGEFRDMVDRADATGKDSPNDTRYQNLYLASPQEITAFAHQAALNIVRDYGFTQATDPGEIVRVSPRSIMLAVDKVTGDRFKNPRNRKEIPIRKRYLKLVYQEVQRYLDQLRSKLTNK